MEVIHWLQGLGAPALNWQALEREFVEKTDWLQRLAPALNLQAFLHPFNFFLCSKACADGDGVLERGFWC